MARARADKSQSLNVLVLPLPSRHDDNCSIGTIGGGRMPDAVAPHACSFTSSADYELALILKEIRFITDQVSMHVTLPPSTTTTQPFYYRPFTVKLSLCEILLF
jgi:hypothetical protein